MHSASAPQGEPAGTFGKQTPAAQKALVPQLAFVVQPPAQRVPEQVPGAQAASCFAGQRPLPVQRPSTVATAAVQLACRHTVSVSG